MAKNKTKENPNAFKLWINSDVVTKYFFNTRLSKKEIKKISDQLESLELKARVQHIAINLRPILPEHYPTALQALLEIARSQNLKSFELWPATEFIQTYGLEHVDESLAAMYELTQKFTAEFCIRPFINHYGDQIYKKISVWTQDPNEHIRRWLSEGTRPRLPWGEKLSSAIKSPKNGLKIIEQLRFDPSLYVRKSVSNHLNDIAKDHPDLVVQTLSRWKKQVPSDYQKEFQFISQRALRSLIKSGHRDALIFSGVNLTRKCLKTSNLKISKSNLKVNDTLEFNLTIRNTTSEPESFIIDYIIYFRKSNGSLSPKVFKLKSGILQGHQQLTLTKRHRIKPITTRKYYPGLHKLSIQLNGAISKPINFELVF